MGHYFLDTQYYYLWAPRCLSHADSKVKIITQPRTSTRAAIGQTRTGSILIGQIDYSFVITNVNIDDATVTIELQRQTEKCL